MQIPSRIFPWEQRQRCSFIMTQVLRQNNRGRDNEPEELSFDEYIFCSRCGFYVYEYCSMHGRLLVIPDEKVAPGRSALPPRAALSLPRVFLHLAPSTIPDAGIGVFSTLALPRGVRFGPFRGVKTKNAASAYCWQIYDREHKPCYVIDARDPNRSNWMRYVNCSRHCSEQNLIAFQYQGQLYYRTIRIIPRFTELLVFYGCESALALKIDLRQYHSLAHAGTVQFVSKCDTGNYNQNIRKALNDEAANVLKAGETSKADEPEDISDETTENDNANVECVTYNANNNCEQIISTTQNNVTEKDPNINSPSVHDTKNDGENENYVDEAITKSNNIINDAEEQKYEMDDNFMPAEDLSDLNSLDNYNDNGHIFNETAVFAAHIQKENGDKNGEADNFPSEFNNDETKSDLKMQNIKHDSKFKNCSYCEYKTNCGNKLKEHILRHLGQKPYKCNTCSYACVRNYELKVHYRAHTGEKPYVCIVCNSKFRSKNSLNRHFKKHSESDASCGKYECDSCAFKCTDKTTLIAHLRIHNKVKSFSCEICGSKFSTNKYLKVHRNTHTKEIKFNCSDCGNKFSRKDCLFRHAMRFHNKQPHVCETCGWKFSSEITLQRHKNIHTRKNFECQFCNAKFTSVSSLNRHKKIHMEGQ